MEGALTGEVRKAAGDPHSDYLVVDVAPLVARQAVAADESGPDEGLSSMEVDQVEKSFRVIHSYVGVI